MRAAILSVSVNRGDEEDVSVVKELFYNWSKLNKRYQLNADFLN